MVQTIADMDITDTWQSVNTVESIAIGTRFDMQNKSHSVFLLAEGSQPSASSTQGSLLYPRQTKRAEHGSLEIWVRCFGFGGKLHVEEV